MLRIPTSTRRATTTNTSSLLRHSSLPVSVDPTLPQCLQSHPHALACAARHLSMRAWCTSAHMGFTDKSGQEALLCRCWDSRFDMARTVQRRPPSALASTTVLSCCLEGHRRPMHRPPKDKLALFYAASRPWLLSPSAPCALPFFVPSLLYSSTWSLLLLPPDQLVYRLRFRVTPVLAVVALLAGCHSCPRARVPM